MKDIVKQAFIDGEPINLAYTVRAMMDVNRVLKQDDETNLELVDVILSDDQSKLEVFAGVVEVLNYSAELLRTSRGLEQGQLVSASKVINMVSPAELLPLKETCMSAILAGLGREEQNSDTDVGLAELEKKKNPRKPK